LLRPPGKNKSAVTFAKILPFAFPHQPTQPFIHMADITGGTAQRLRAGNLIAHQFSRRTFNSFALQRQCWQTNRRPFIITDAVPQFLFVGLFAPFSKNAGGVLLAAKPFFPDARNRRKPHLEKIVDRLDK